MLLKTVYDNLVTKVNALDSSRFVLKIQYNIDKSGLEMKVGDADKKMPDTNGIVKNWMFEGKIPNIIGLATT